MGAFKTLVQRGKIIGPMRRQFDPAHWSVELQKHGADDEDKNLHDAGLEIYSKGGAIRSALKVTNSSLSATTKLRAFVAISNYNFSVLKEKIEQNFAKHARDVRAAEPPPVLVVST